MVRYVNKRFHLPSPEISNWCVAAGFVQVMENLESHGFSNFIFQGWKIMDFKCGQWKVMENDVYSKVQNKLGFFREEKCTQDER